MLKRLTLLGLLVSLIGVPARAQSAVKGSGTLESVIRKVAEQQKKTRTIQADFTQEREVALLSRPEVSKGTFVYSKPNNVLWKYETPKPVTMLISKGVMTTYFPELHKAESAQVKRFEERIFKYMGASGAIEELTKYFNFTFVESKGKSFYTLELIPKTKVIARRVKRIKMWIDRETYLTTKFEYVEGDGDLTRYEFTNVRFNQDVPQSLFAISLPADVRVQQMKLE